MVLRNIYAVDYALSNSFRRAATLVKALFIFIVQSLGWYQNIDTIYLFGARGRIRNSNKGRFTASLHGVKLASGYYKNAILFN